MKIRTYFLNPLVPKFWESYVVVGQQINGTGWLKRESIMRTITSADVIAIQNRFLGIKVNWGTLRIEPPSREPLEITNVSDLLATAKELRRIADGRPLSTKELNKRKLSQVKSANELQFCDQTDHVQEKKVITAKFGTFVVHGDGTFTDNENQLMWIQAPWGYNWNGSKFEGEPITMPWDKATKYFGEGMEIQLTTSGINGVDLLRSSNMNHYKRGDCRMSFAGYSDWRMPTAFELNTISLVDKDNHYYDQKDTETREELLPFSVHDVWSATSNGSELAWASDGQKDLGDYQKYKDKKIYFLRRA